MRRFEINFGVKLKNIVRYRIGINPQLLTRDVPEGTTRP